MLTAEAPDLDTVIAEVGAFWMRDVRRSADGKRYVAIYPLMFTHAIIAGTRSDSHDDRWCYHTYEAAKSALDGWSGNEGTEPEGWHRHPGTGRRRPDGDATREYVKR